MWLTDARDFFDESGKPRHRAGPERVLGEFFRSIVAWAAMPTAADTPRCRRCDNDLASSLTGERDIAWSCAHCGAEGVISHWSSLVPSADASVRPT